MRERFTRQAFFISGVYFIIGAVYIFLSDTVLEGLVHDIDTLSEIQSYKGLGFVLLTALLIFFLVNNQIRRKNKLINDLRAQKNEFESLYEEYLSANEELNHVNELISESEKTLLTTLYSIGDGLITTDREGKIIRMNPIAEKLTGWSEEEARGELSGKIFRVIDELTRKPVHNPVEEVLKAGQPTSMAKHSLLVSKSGSFHPISDSGAPIVDEQGNLIGVVLVFSDQSEEREAQKSLLINKFCLDHSSIGIFRISEEDGHIIDFNGYACQMLGYPADEMSQLTIFDIDPKLDRKKWSRFVPDLKQKNQNTLESVNRKKDGTLIPVEITISLFEYEGEKFFFSFSKDITERKQYTEGLKESEARYRNIFENNHTVMLLIDPSNGTIVDANQAAENFYGWDHDHLANMKISDINTLSEKKIFEAIDKVVTTGRSGFEFKHRLSNGETRDVEVFSGPISVKNRNLIYSIINDISERKRAREELIIAKEKAEENDKLKTAFLNNMSHEIRTPMNGILGFSSLLMQDDLSEERRKEFIRIIENSGEQLVRIIDDIIDYSRIETGQVDIIKGEFSLNETMDTIYSLLEQEAARRKKDITISLHKTLPDGADSIISDRGRLAQIINNLGMNALKFTDEGSVELGYEVINGDLRFHVKDTGIGIPETDREKVFDRFHQANVDIARSYSGTGLGLSIARGLTELLDGEIYFDSTPGEGTVFYVRLPYNPSDALKRDIAPSAKSNPDFRNKTFLVAEDVPESQELIISYLSSTGASILVAVNGNEAIEYVENNTDIDLVLMDIRMPGMDGVEAMKAIKKKYPGLPVIAQTAHAMASDRDTYLETGFDEYVSKPLNNSELIKFIEKCLIRSGEKK